MHTIFLAGDSTCAFNGPDRNPAAGWGQYLAGFLAEGWSVDNRAVNGRSTKSFIDEGRWTGLIADVRPGDLVFIQFGHNDMKIDDPVRYADPNVSYPANLHAMVDAVRNRGGLPVILSSVARRRFGEDKKLIDTLEPYHTAAQKAAAAFGVPFIDAHALTSAWIAALGDKASKAYFLHLAPGAFPAFPDGSVDDTHFRHEGAREVARMIAEVAKAIPELAEAFAAPR